jgi:hypothetical protein
LEHVPNATLYLQLNFLVWAATKTNTDNTGV